MVKFTYNKKGQKLAYQFSSKACRWIRISIDEAEMLIATQKAILVEEGML